MTSVLAIDNLSVSFATPDGDVEAVTDVSLSVEAGECLGLVGESGSGKSQTFMAAMGLLAENGTANGHISLDGLDLLSADEKKLNTVRGERIAMIFQDPMTSLTPHMKIGRQLSEVLIEHQGVDKETGRRRALEMLDRVHIPEAERRLDMYPHELSGGLRQRVMIAIALMCEPEVIIADEPTTALDVTVQAQILDLLMEVKANLGAAIVLITHDLGVVAGLADRVAVMYAGRIVEQGSVADTFASPVHPYTQGLLDCTPSLDVETEALETISGQPPNLQSLPTGCSFHPRCPHVFDRCQTERPLLERTPSGQSKACFYNGAEAG
ncbi:MAG: ABC transporter ATP-binding protein [Rhodospirillaceae bacterium]|nr:ABC transporter ATP-binding protein [Rhodospirillaceae bacterium]